MKGRLFIEKGSFSQLLTTTKQSIISTIGNIPCDSLVDGTASFHESLLRNFKMQELVLNWENLEGDFEQSDLPSTTALELGFIPGRRIKQNVARYTVPIINGKFDHFFYHPSSYSMIDHIGIVKNGTLSFYVGTGSIGVINEHEIDKFKAGGMVIKDRLTKAIQSINSDINQFNKDIEIDIAQLLARRYNECDVKNRLRTGLKF